MDAEGTNRLVARVLDEAGVPTLRVPPDVEVTRRFGSDGRSWAFALNHGDEEVRLPLTGYDLVSDRPVPDALVLPAGASAVVREH